MSTFQQSVYDITLASLQATAEEASGEVSESMISQAEDISLAVANSVHSGLVQQIGNLSQSINTVMTAIATWAPTVPVGTGSAAVAAAATACATIATTLKTAAGNYHG